MRLARRAVLQSLATAAALLPMGQIPTLGAPPVMRRLGPGDPDRPSPTIWEQLNQAVGGQLIRVKPLLAACEEGPNSAACSDLLHGVGSERWSEDGFTPRRGPL